MGARPGAACPSPLGLSPLPPLSKRPPPGLPGPLSLTEALTHLSHLLPFWGLFSDFSDQGLGLPEFSQCPQVTCRGLQACGFTSWGSPVSL